MNQFWNGTFSNVLARLDWDCGKYAEDLCKVLEANDFVRINDNRRGSPRIYQKQQIQIVLVYNYHGFVASAFIVEVYIACVNLTDVDATKLLLEEVKPEHRPQPDASFPAKKPSWLFRWFGIL